MTPPDPSPTLPTTPDHAAKVSEAEAALRDVLALAFHVDASRLSIEILSSRDGDLLEGISVMLDGRDLSAEQEAFVTRLLAVVAEATGAGPFILAHKA